MGKRQKTIACQDGAAATGGTIQGAGNSSVAPKSTKNSAVACVATGRRSDAAPRESVAALLRSTPLPILEAGTAGTAGQKQGLKVVERGKKQQHVQVKPDGSRATVRSQVKEQRVTNRCSGAHVETKNSTKQRCKKILKDGSRIVS